MIDAFRAFLLEGDYHRAVEIFSELSSAYPGDPYLPAYLGFRYDRNLKRHEDADTGKYVVVWVWTPEGWKLHRDIWTTDRPSAR